MTQQALVSYFFHSAFTVSLQKTLLVFSYRQKDLPQLVENQYLSEKDFHGFNNILVFVPSASAAHHDPVIYTWKQSFPITYIMPPEAAKSAPRAANVRICREGDKFTIGHSEISVYGLTDTGVSYLVTAEGLSTFHAGDLNLWHWREENTLREIARAETLFYEKVAKIPKDVIDLCFFPLDPNQGGFYDAGANHFIMSLRPRVFFPMHFGLRPEIANEYARRVLSRRTVVFALTRVRESALVDLSGSAPLVRSSISKKSERGLARSSVDLGAYIHEDPFAQTDLPVSIKEEKNT
jgi:hypothetical protein